MADSHEQRIAKIEGHLEKLYDVTRSGGARIAVLEAASLRASDDIRSMREEMRRANIALRTELAAAQEAQHKRTMIVLMIAIAVFSTLAPPLVDLFMR